MTDFDNPDIRVRLKAWGSIKEGDTMPYQFNWGPPLTKVFNDALAEIEQLRNQLEDAQVSAETS